MSDFLSVPVRTQVDGLGDAVDAVCVLSCPESEDCTRQEFKSDSDILTILRRYGPNLPYREPIFAEVNDQVDLRQAFEIVETAREGFEGLPEPVKAHFGTWDAMAAFIASGAVLERSRPNPEPGTGSSAAQAPDQAPPAG